MRWQALHSQATRLIHEASAASLPLPSDRELAIALELSLAEWQEIKLAFKNRSILSLDTPMSDDDEGTASLGDLMPDPQYRSFQLAQEDQIRLQQALVQLEQVTRQVVEFVFLYDLTQKETAERMGLSCVTVSRRVKKGLESLKHIMGSDH
jgi:RNA polymerase sigma-B factor